MAQKIREDLVQGVVDDAADRVNRGETGDLEGVEDAVEIINVAAEAFEIDLTDNETQVAAKRLLEEFAE